MKEIVPDSVMGGGEDGNTTVSETISFYKEMTILLEGLVNELECNARKLFKMDF